MSKRLIGGALLGVMCLATTPCWAADEAWQWSFTPYLWAAGVNGDVTAGTRSAEIDASFSDILDHFDLGFLGHLEGKQGRWSVALSPIYMKLSAEAERTGPGGGSREAKLDMEMTIAEFFTAYQLSEAWELMGGFRYVRADVELEFTGPVLTGKGDATEEFADPIFGARYTRQINDKWSFRGRGDVGGFGAGSKFAWNATALFGYRRTADGGLWLIGYRALDMEFDGDDGELDLLMSGPIVGYVFTF